MDELNEPGPQPESDRIPDSEHRQQAGVQKDSPGSGVSNRDDSGGQTKGLEFPLASLGLEENLVLGSGGQTPSRPWWGRVDYRETPGGILRRG